MKRCYLVLLLLPLMLLAFYGANRPVNSGENMSTASSGADYYSQSAKGYEIPKSLLAHYLEQKCGVTDYNIIDLGYNEANPDRAYYWVVCETSGERIPEQGVLKREFPDVNMPNLNIGDVDPKIPNVELHEPGGNGGGPNDSDFPESKPPLSEQSTYYIYNDRVYLEPPKA